MPEDETKLHHDALLSALNPDVPGYVVMGWSEGRRAVWMDVARTPAGIRLIIGHMLKDVKHVAEVEVFQPEEGQLRSVYRVSYRPAGEDNVNRKKVSEGEL